MAQSDPLALPGRTRACQRRGGGLGSAARHCAHRFSGHRTRRAALRRYAGVVLNEFWATATASYKVLVFGAMGLIAAGIVLNIVGNVSRNQGVAIASLPVIGAGLLLHGAGRVVRGWKVRRMLRK